MIVIIGAGIAGLYVGRSLMRLGIEFIILEGSDEAGGKFYTSQIGPYAVEVGASEIRRGQKLFDIVQPEIKAPGGRVLIFGSAAPIQLSEVMGKLRQGRGAQNVSVDERAAQVLSAEEYNNFKLMMPNWFEIKRRNVCSWLREFTVEKNSEIYFKRGGLGPWIRDWAAQLRNVIYLRHRVIEINSSARKLYVDMDGTKKNICFDQLILCTDQTSAAQIYPHPLWQDLTVISTLRFYILFSSAEYRHRELWTDRRTKWAIWVAPRLVMIYVDGEAADYFRDVGEKRSLEIICQDLRAAGWKLGKVQEMRFFYSADSFNIWLRYICPRLVPQLCADPPIYQTVAPVGNEQDWAESHLLAADAVLEKIRLYQ